MRAAPTRPAPGDILARNVGERPDAPAVVDVDAQRTWSWAELDGRAAAVAVALIERVGPGGRVGLTMPASAAGVAAVHGALRAGVTAILVNPRLTDHEVATLLAVGGTDAIVRADEVDDRWARSAAVPGRPGGELVVATSGTTARPKLARLPADRLLASATAWNAVLPSSTGWLLALGLEHVAGLGVVLRAALAGVPVVVAPAGSAASLLAAAEPARGLGVVVSHASLVTAQLSAILAATGDGPPPPGLRAVVLGGGPVPDTLLARARGIGWPVITSYGMSETASGVVADGQALPGAEIRLAVDGEILVRGPMVFAGYLDDPAATATKVDADGWLHTGDLGRTDAAGRLAVDGRRDALIIRGGENVSPAEVEAALADHPGVADVAVVGVADAVLGAVPVAVLVLAAGMDPSDEELRAHARARLAGYKVPARFVRVGVLPRTRLGKIARADVARTAASAERVHVGTADDGQRLAVWSTGPTDGPPVILLHATMASAAHLAPLARLLAEDAQVVRMDRRGSGRSAMAQPAPVPVERHVHDVVAVLDALGIERASIVGHSFGGVVAIETARRHPARVRAVVAWEPPFVPVAPESFRSGLSAVGDAVAAGFAADGAAGAARGFVESVGGPAAWAAIPERQRAAMGRAGGGALADAAMTGLTGEGLESITAPTLILTGSASEPFYRSIADALAARIGGAATRAEVAGLDHMGPGHTPAPVADAVRRHLGLPDPDEETAP